MPEVLAVSELVGAAGWVGAFALMFVALARGWLWTGGQVQTVVADKNQQITDWRQAYVTERARADVLAANQERAIVMLERLAERSSHA